MKGFMADIIGVNEGCSLESLLAAVSESLELSPLLELSLLLLLWLLFLFELPLDEELDEEPPPTRFWMKSCNLPHWTSLAGIRNAIRQSAQATTVANLIVVILLLFLLLQIFPILRLFCDKPSRAAAADDDDDNVANCVELDILIS